MTKAELRLKMREEGKRRSATERAEASRRICEHIRGAEVWQRASTVLLFVPLASEPDVSPLMNEGKRVSLPTFSGDRYEAREIQSGGDLLEGKFGILEPKPTCALTDVSTLDLVIAPGVAFALDGTRLGRGKGYYDRLLAQVPAIKIGVCFEWQVVNEAPRDSHDVLMDYVLTANGLLRARKFKQP